MLSTQPRSFRIEEDRAYEDDEELEPEKRRCGDQTLAMARPAARNEGQRDRFIEHWTPARRCQLPDIAVGNISDDLCAGRQRRPAILRNEPNELPARRIVQPRPRQRPAAAEIAVGLDHPGEAEIVGGRPAVQLRPRDMALLAAARVER